MELKNVGSSARRVDAVAKVTGAAKFVADIKVDRMLHAKVLRSGVPHARIARLDTEKAQAAPGVHAVVTGKGCRILFGTCLWDQPPIAVDKVRHAGEAVAVVVADTVSHAEAALKLIDVEYEPLPFVTDPLKALQPDAPIIHEKNGEYRRVKYIVLSESGNNVFHHYKLRKGDAAGAFKSCDVVVEDEFEYPLMSHAALEPHGAICRFGADRSIEIWASNQAPFVLRDVLSDMFGIPNTKIRVHIPYLGGGFGGKSDISIEPMVAYAASFVPGYAVKLVLTRKEVFTSSLVGRGMKGKMKLGATKDGKLQALEATMCFSDGAYGDTGWPVVTVAGHNCTGPYEIPNCTVDALGIYTNTPPVGAYRGYGHPEGQLMCSRLMDVLARKLGIPLPDLMRRNFLSEGKKNGLGQVIKKSNGDLEACLAAVEKTLSEKPKPAEDSDYYYGRGLAAMKKSPKMAANASSCAYVQMSPDGSFFVNLAGIEMGQGCHTVFSQMAAEALLVPMERVRMYSDVDTQFTPWEWQTVASMQTYRGGRAIVQACRRAVDILKENAALVLECKNTEIEYDGNFCFVANKPEKRVSAGSLARGYMYENGLTVGTPVQATGSYRVAGVTEPDPKTGMGNAAGSWTFGVQAADIRIEKATGKIEVLHFVSAFDPGKVVNPLLCRGQITGGVVQGIGHALFEKIQVGEDGVIRGANFGPYHIPTIKDAPPKQTVTFIETPNEEGPWSAKPIAEHPIVVVPAVILNAIRDAIGVEFRKVPVTPADVLAALKERR